MKLIYKIKYRKMNKANRALFHINKAKRKVSAWANKEDFDCVQGTLLGIIMAMCFILALFV